MTLSIWAAARESPNAPALISDARCLSYADLAAEASRALSWLERHAAFERNPVALVPEADVPSVAMLHALIGGGVPALLVHPRLTPAERQALLEDAGQPPLVDAGWWRSDGPAGAVPAPIADPKRPLAIVFTSGTSRRPKGVILSRGAFVASAAASQSNLAVGPGDRWLLSLPPAHVGGLSILTRCLLSRSAVVLATPAPGDVRPSARRLAELLAAHAVTLASLVPAQLSALLDLEPQLRPPPGLRAVLLGGAPASAALLSRAADRGFPVLTTYGLTEACSQVATQRPGTINRGDLGVGRPLPGVEIAIRGGSVRIRGPMLFDGYWRSAEPALDAQGWFDTGDLGRLDADGTLRLSGRRDELIVTGGENVSPADVEAVLESHPALADACVFGVPDERWGQLVAAAVTARPGHEPDLTALDAWARARLAAHKLPRLWCVLPALSRHPSGKLDRAATALAARSRLGAVRGAG